MKATKLNSWQLISLTSLRIVIGWHFLYEGLIKLTNPEWSASPFLNNAEGPFAAIFQAMGANPTMLVMVDFLNQWGLVAIGISLMLGLFSRWASIGGMLLLGLYYFANPPFIGLGNASMMEGHYLIVNKNLIELIALFVLFQFNDSKALGLDRFLSGGNKNDDI